MIQNRAAGRNYRVPVFAVRAYATLALAAAAVLSPLALSFVPVLLLIWYAGVWRWPFNPQVRLLTEYFAFYAIALLYSAALAPPLALLAALPVMLAVNHALETAAMYLSFRESRHARRPTDTGITLFVITAAVLALSLLTGNLALQLAAAAASVYLGVLAIFARRMPAEPLRADPVQHRMLAGTKARLDVRLVVAAGAEGPLVLKASRDWIGVSPDALALQRPGVALSVSLEPELAGPGPVELAGQATDRWGLIRTSFKVVPVELYVIPRAGYAEWLARRYFGEAGAGALPQVPGIGSLKPEYGLRQGVEYYGSHVYQPGDSLRSIDWKHSLMLNELISKEFVEFHSRPAVLLVNLAVSSETESDRLACKIIMAALSLAQENIPAALAVYDHLEVCQVTATLQPRELVRQAVAAARGIVQVTNPRRYLNPPDVTRLRASIGRLGAAEGRAARVLAGLLQLEYRSLDIGARQNPATAALAGVFSRVDRQAGVLVISQRNHDAEAIAFNTFDLARRGNKVIDV